MTLNYDPKIIYLKLANHTNVQWDSEIQWISYTQTETVSKYAQDIFNAFNEKNPSFKLFELETKMEIDELIVHHSLTNHMRILARPYVGGCVIPFSIASKDVPAFIELVTTRKNELFLSEQEIEYWPVIKTKPYNKVLKEIANMLNFLFGQSTR